MVPIPSVSVLAIIFLISSYFGSNPNARIAIMSPTGPPGRDLLALPASQDTQQSGFCAFRVEEPQRGLRSSCSSTTMAHVSSHFSSLRCGFWIHVITFIILKLAS